MSDYSQGPGWWQAADGRWYPPPVTPMPESEVISGEIIEPGSRTYRGDTGAYRQADSYGYGGNPPAPPTPPAPPSPPKKSYRGCIIAVVVTLVVLALAVVALIAAVVWGFNQAKNEVTSAFEGSGLTNTPLLPEGGLPFGQLPNGENPIGDIPLEGSGISSGKEDITIAECAMSSDNARSFLAGPKAVISITNSTDQPASYVAYIEFVAQDGGGTVASGVGGAENVQPGETVTATVVSLGGRGETRAFDCNIAQALRTTSAPR